MLKDALREIAATGTIDRVALTKRLGVGEALVAQVVEQLRRLGYLQTIDNSCDTGCGACAHSRGCDTQDEAAHATVVIWTLTPKGQRAAGIAC